MGEKVDMGHAVAWVCWAISIPCNISRPAYLLNYVPPVDQQNQVESVALAFIPIRDQRKVGHLIVLWMDKSHLFALLQSVWASSGARALRFLALLVHRKLRHVLEWSREEQPGGKKWIGPSWFTCSTARNWQGSMMGVVAVTYRFASFAGFFWLQFIFLRFFWNGASATRGFQDNVKRSISGRWARRAIFFPFLPAEVHAAPTAACTGWEMFPRFGLLLSIQIPGSRVRWLHVTA